MPTPTPSPRALLVALNAAPGIGRAAVCRLAESAGRWRRGAASPAAVEALAADLGVPGGVLERARAVAGEAGRLAAAEEDRAAAAGARLLTRLDPDYPEALRRLALPPPVLCVRGELPDGPAVAVVGSRGADPYGLEAAGLFARSLAAAGVTVVSGFARGVDAAAHRGALAGGGRTVAVLGCGIDVAYPRGHGKLAAEVATAGALISELPCGAPPLAAHFPVRNRIIAALAEGTLVVEATPRSGSLITARLAMELGRDVYAVPGRIFDERSLGPNTLIRDGALLAQHPKDVLEALPLAAREALATRTGVDTADGAAQNTAEPAPPLPGLRGRLLAALPPGRTRSPEELAAALDPAASIDRVLGALLELELAGWVRRHPGPLYARASG